MLKTVMKLSVAAALLCSLPAVVHPQQPGNGRGSGIMYVGIFPNKIVAIDERDHKVVAEIALETGAPQWVMASYDGRRLVSITSQRNIEVVDLVARKSLGHFALSDANSRPLVLFAAIGPRGRYLYLMVKTAIKEVDRYTLEKAKFYVADLDQKKIARTFDFPAEFDEGFGFEDAGFKISADEKLLYVIKDDILIYDLEHFREVDKIELSKPLYPGLFPISLDADSDPKEEPDNITSTFNAEDPVARRPVAGLVRINLRTKEIELMPVGPALPIRGGLFLSADRKKAFAVIVSNAQNPNRRPEFWVFDLESHKLLKRAEFDNRARFTFAASSDGGKLYIYGPGPVIDIYDSESLKLEKTITLEGDITEMTVVRLPN